MEPAVLTYSSLDDFNHSAATTELFFFGETNFNLDNVSDGYFTVLYEQILAADATVADGETIFSVTFDVVGATGSSSEVSFTDDPTLRKLASFGGAAPDLKTVNATISIGTSEQPGGNAGDGADNTNQAPTLALVDPNVATHEAGTAWQDPGATATDAEDDDATLTSAIVVTGSVNKDTLECYTLTYDVTDSGGLDAQSITRTVEVVDTTAPVISFASGVDIDLTVEAGVAYTDVPPGVVDSFDSNVAVVTSGAVNVQIIDSYQLTYSAVDASGNAAQTVVRTVIVADTIAPEISLNGAALVSHPVGVDYNDLGAVATDSFEGTTAVIAVGEVDVDTLGDYVLTYNYSDSSGNAAAQVTRTVSVVDSAAPIITLNGSDPLQHEAGTTFVDPGAVSNDAQDGSKDLTGTGSVEASVLGTYVLTYEDTDSSGNAAIAVTREVNVVDTIAPIISFGDGVDVDLTVEAGVAYEDVPPGVSDSFDTSVTVETLGQVDTSQLGIYTLTYSASDASGNPADQVLRTVTVVDTTAPIITLNGELEVTLEAGEDYVDAHAMVEDSFDSEVSVVVEGVVDIGTVGTYTLTFNAVDASGNEAIEVARTVSVVDTTAPILTLIGDAEDELDFGSEWVDPGVQLEENTTEELGVNVTGEVQVFVDGVYTLTYSAIDGSGNEGQVQGVVTVLPREGSLLFSLPLLEDVLPYTSDLNVPIQIDGFDQVGYFDFGVEWDPAVVSFLGVEGASYQEATTPVDDGADGTGSESESDSWDGEGALIYMDAINVQEGATTVTVPVKVKGFAGIGGFQFTLAWDPAFLTFNSLSDFDHSDLATELFYFTQTNFNLDNVSDGYFTVLYEQILAADATVADGETIFSVTFDVVGASGLQARISLTDDPTLRKLASFGGVAPALQTMDAQITIGEPSSNDPVSTVGGYQLALGEGTLLIEMSEAEDGSLGLSWSNNNGEDETLPDATEIILLFDVVGMGGDASPLTFVGDPENAVGSFRPPHLPTIFRTGPWG